MRLMWIVIAVLTLPCPAAPACSGVARFGDGIAIVGSNEDQDSAMFRAAAM